MLFYTFLYAHGLMFVWWASLPLAIWRADRYFRYRRRAQTLPYLVDATYVAPMLELRWFASPGGKPFHFVEGQYVRLASPAVSSQEWHPFAVSSPSEAEYVTVHVRVQADPDTWTHRLKDEIFNRLADGDGDGRGKTRRAPPPTRCGRS